MNDFEILGFHVHLDYQADVAAFVKAARKLHLAAAVSAVGPMAGGWNNEATAAAFRKYPGTIFGMGYIALGRGDTPKTVERLHKQGFRGLKCIWPTKDYDDEEFFPIYAKAEQLGMPILFHTGMVARADVWLDARRKSGRPVPPHGDPRTFNISVRRMDPMCVDTIGRVFTRLNLIMAHFGSTGRRDLSEGIIKFCPNIYGDLSSTFSGAYVPDKSERGWHIERKFVKMFKDILEPIHAKKYTAKLLFGTDTEISEPEYMAAKVASQRAVYRALDIDRAGQRLILRDTAVRLLGLE